MLGQRLDIRQGQGLVITPQLQQAIKLLQLSSQELDAFIEAELERNPLLQREDAEPGGEIDAPAPTESHDAAEQALAGALRLLVQFDDPERAYLSRTAPQFVHDYAGDYAHLARVFEWSTSGEDGEGEA